MNWGLEDLVAAAALLLAATFGVMIVVRSVANRPLRLALLLAVIGLTLAIWAHLAVGIF